MLKVPLPVCLLVLCMLLGQLSPLFAAPQSNSCTTSVGSTWTEVGPSPYMGLNPEGGLEALSGQVSAIAVDLVNDSSGNTVYIGSSSGGVWKSTNGLSPHPTFNPISDQSQSLSVGAIALDTRTNPPGIFVGTGAPDNSANISSYTGTGILISADGGRNWRRVDSADGGTHPFTGQGFSSILIDPDNPGILLASTGIGVDPNSPAYSIPQGSTIASHFGIFRSVDGGSTWARVMAVTDPDTIMTGGGVFHTDLLYEPTQKTYFAGLSQAGMFISTDQGAHWNTLASQTLGKGLPAATDTLKVSLTTRNGILWALMLTTGSIFQLFESDDHAATWKKVPAPPITPWGTLMFIAAPPGSEGLVAATNSIFRTDNISAPNPVWNNIQHSLHTDQHAIAFASATNWYEGNDGGVWSTAKRGDAWTSINDDLRTLEMFSAEGDSGGGSPMAAGAQDDGAMETGGPPSFQQLPFFADGSFAIADPRKPGAFFVSFPFGSLNYTPAPPLSPVVPIVNFALGSNNMLTPFELLPTDSRLFTGVTAFGSFNFPRSRIFIAGSDNPVLIAFDPDAASNKTVSVPLTTTINKPIQFIAPVPGDPTTAFMVSNTVFGTPPSTLLRVSNINFNGAATFTPISAGPINGTDLLGHLAVSPTHPTTLYVVKLGFLDGQKIFRTDDAGANWANISGNLPNVPVNWITIDPVNPDFIFLGTNLGAFVATDGGVQDEQWQMLGSGLPNVPVTQLKIQPRRRLLASTYGRGIWQLDISRLFHEPPLQYAVKFICGKPDGDSAATGEYLTSIDVHNPQLVPLAFRKKFAIALPNEKAGPISTFFTAKLCSDEAFTISCNEILARTATAAGKFLDGFVVLESDQELDVVGSYSAAGSTKLVETLELERVPPRRQTIVTSKPDLVPSLTCNRFTNQLAATIKNVGAVDAPPSTTSVKFFGGVTVSQLTGAIPAGGSVEVNFDLSKCGFFCQFTLAADSDHQIDESNENNNSIGGRCSQ